MRERHRIGILGVRPGVGRIVRTCAAGRAILSGVILLMTVPGCRAAGNQQMESRIVAAAKPVALAEGEVTVALRASGPRTLAARVDALRAGQHLFLVAGDLRADEQPGVLYQVYLDLPRDGKRASDRAGRHVGYVNFYNAQIGSVRGSAENELTFDITDLAKNLRKRGQLPDATTVTFVPDGKPAARARAVIGRLEIVEQ